MGYTMKGSPAKLGTIQGTAGHRSALKMKVASPAKATDWEAMHAKAKKKYNRYDNLTLEEYTTEAKRQQKHYNETGKWDASGVYDHSGKKKTTTTTTPSTTTTEDKKEKKPRVVKEETKHGAWSGKRKTVYRKDGSIKKEVDKTSYVEGGDKGRSKKKKVYRKDGGLKKEVEKRVEVDAEGKRHVRKYKSKISKKGDAKTRLVYKKDGKRDVHKAKFKGKPGAIELYGPNRKSIKKITTEDGRRTVTKTDDATGVVTTKSRRTLKGILTGKGKKKKEKDSPAKHPAHVDHHAKAKERIKEAGGGKEKAKATASASKE